MNVVEVNCVICGSGRDRSNALYSEFGLTIVQCVTCGLVYVNPRLSDADLDEVYGHNQELNHPGQVREDKTRDPRIYPAFEAKLGRQRLRRIARLRRGKLGCVLDIGCQHGLFLSLARDAGWFPIGIELTTKFAESARREFGIQVYNEKVENIDFGDQRFDLVTLLDVFEHLQDPNAVLQAVHKTMNDDSFLLIKVPNVTFIRLKAFGLSLLFGNDPHAKHDFVNPLGYWMAQEHLYNFSDKTLQKLLLKNGFKKRKSYIEFPSIYGAYFWRDAAQVVVWISSVVVRLVTVGYLNFGRSLVYVFTKS